MLDKKKIKAELKDFSEDAAEAIGEALKEMSGDDFIR